MLLAHSTSDMIRCSKQCTQPLTLAALFFTGDLTRLMSGAGFCDKNSVTTREKPTTSELLAVNISSTTCSDAKVTISSDPPTLPEHNNIENIICY